MHTLRVMSRSALALALAAPLLGAPIARAAGSEMVESTSNVVTAEDVQSTDAMVSGILVNRTDGPLANLELIVSDSFRWKDAWHPGTDDPGTATSAVVPGPIPPHGSIPFRLDRTRLPRSDGSFVTRVDVMGLTTYVMPPQRSDSR